MAWLFNETTIEEPRHLNKRAAASALDTKMAEWQFPGVPYEAMAQARVMRRDPRNPPALLSPESPLRPLNGFPPPYRRLLPPGS